MESISLLMDPTVRTTKDMKGKWERGREGGRGGETEKERERRYIEKQTEKGKDKEKKLRERKTVMNSPTTPSSRTHFTNSVPAAALIHLW